MQLSYDDKHVVGTLLQTSIPVDGDLVNFRARVSDLLGEIKDVSGPENVMKQVSGVVAHNYCLVLSTRVRHSCQRRINCFQQLYI